MVDIVGERFGDDFSTHEKFSGTLNHLKYGETLLAEQKKEQYAFRMGTNGKYHVS